MKLCFAPMEGITTYTYRNAHAEMFGMCDEYFAPFIVPTDNDRLSLKAMRDILPANNTTTLVPQALSNCDKAFVKFSEKVRYLGYNELNLNLGCPASTVVGKRRGSGALKDTEALDRLLDGIFAEVKIDVSVKTRVGFSSHEEFDKILEVYTRYPISRLIVHPRVRDELYRGTPNMDTFATAYGESTSKVYYNGNINTPADYKAIADKFDRLGGVMIGRGAIMNPAIFREIRGGAPLTTAELVSFSKLVESRYMELLQSDLFTLYKLKEIWMYSLLNYPEEKAITKAVRKANCLAELNSAIESLPEISR